MDRVLVIIDDIQYNRHVEMTLRKFGFDVESINNEFNLNDSLLSYNPDYIICKGSSNRLSSLSVGKKLKDLTGRFNVKVILIIPEKIKLEPEELAGVKMDLLLLEPLSTLRLIVHLFSLTNMEMDVIKEKLLKFAATDNQFRNYEQQMLKDAGMSMESEMQVISGMQKFSKGEAETRVSGAGSASGAGEIAPPGHSSELIEKINQEVANLENEMPLRIDSYNRLINKVDQDLKIGLKKKHSKAMSNQLRKDLIAAGKTDINSEKELNDEKVRFTRALFKK